MKTWLFARVLKAHGMGNSVMNRPDFIVNYGMTFMESTSIGQVVASRLCHFTTVLLIAWLLFQKGLLF